jgi:hypothetical protein
MSYLEPHVWSTNVNCMVYVDDLLLTNNYQIEVGFFTSTPNAILHDIALEKIEVFFELLMKDCIIITKENYDKENRTISNNWLMVDDLLNDQTVATMIFSKLVSIVGADLDIEFLRLSSALGNNIRYTISNDSPELSVLLPNKETWCKDSSIKFDPWWMRSDTATFDTLIDQNDFFKGLLRWEDVFGEDLAKAQDDDPKKNKFKIIAGGKDED